VHRWQPDSVSTRHHPRVETGGCPL
jgi:hypothetical protein